MANVNLTQAKKAKQDEFYTQYADIEREMRAYLDLNPDVFRDRTILLPCDDPEWSNFTRYFAANFERHGLKKLISTSYAPSRRQDLFSDNDAGDDHVHGKVYILDRDHNQDGRIDLDDLNWKPLEGDGDFRSDEVTALRDEADIVITNPPFSLFREYIAWLITGNKLFVAIGSINAITYKEVFPLIRDNLMWMGATAGGSDMVFAVPKGTPIRESDKEKAARLGYVGNYTRLGNSCWYANIDHGRRHDPIPLMTMAENLRFHTKMKDKSTYDRYENYNAIEVPATSAIPCDYNGIMGVPITFLDKYCPEQFQILGTSDRGGDGQIDYMKIPHPRTDAPVINGDGIYKRIFIKAIQ